MLVTPLAPRRSLWVASGPVRVLGLPLPSRPRLPTLATPLAPRLDPRVAFVPVKTPSLPLPSRPRPLSSTAPLPWRRGHRVDFGPCGCPHPLLVHRSSLPPPAPSVHSLPIGAPIAVALDLAIVQPSRHRRALVCILPRRDRLQLDHDPPPYPSRPPIPPGSPPLARPGGVMHASLPPVPRSVNPPPLLPL